MCQLKTGHCWITYPPSLRVQRALTGARWKGVMPKLMVSSSLIRGRTSGWSRGQNCRLSRPSSSAAARLRHDGWTRRLMPVWSKCSRGYGRKGAYSIKIEIRRGEEMKSAWSKATKGIRQSLNYLCSISEVSKLHEHTSV